MHVIQALRAAKNLFLFFHLIFFFLLKRDERVRSGKLSWGGGQDHPLPGHEQHGLHTLHRQDHRNPTCTSFHSVSDSNPNPCSTWPKWLRIRVQLGLCGSGSGFNLAYVAPDPCLTWPVWLRIRVQLGLCGSGSGFILAYVAPEPVSTWPVWLQIRVQLGLCGSRSGFNLDWVGPDPGSTWSMWLLQIRLQLGYVAPDPGSTWTVLIRILECKKTHKKWKLDISCLKCFLETCQEIYCNFSNIKVKNVNFYLWDLPILIINPGLGPLFTKKPVCGSGFNRNVAEKVDFLSSTFFLHR